MPNLWLNFFIINSGVSQGVSLSAVVTFMEGDEGPNLNLNLHVLRAN